MGFFAVSSLGIETAFTIEACHISLWVLPKPWYQLFGNNFCFDVGLRFRSESPLRPIRIVLPFDFRQSQVSDLSAIVLDQDFSPLIFGKPVQVADNHITYDAPKEGEDKISDKVIPISTDNSSAEEASSAGTGFSIWTIELAEPTKSSEWTYIRFRSQQFVASLGLERLGARKTRSRSRLSNFRHSRIASLGHGKSESEHLVPIKQLFLFLVAPSYFVPSHFSPNLHYSRLLEPKVWEKYLSGFESHTDGAKFSIHQWRHTKEPEISVDYPFRAYMDLSREFGREVFLFYVLAIVTLPIVSHLAEALGRYLWSLVF